MTPSDLEELIESLRKEIDRRLALGGYSQDAESILFLFQAVSNIASHVATMKIEVLEARRMARNAARKLK